MPLLDDLMIINDDDDDDDDDDDSDAVTELYQLTIILHKATVTRVTSTRRRRRMPVCHGHHDRRRGRRAVFDCHRRLLLPLLYPVSGSRYSRRTADSRLRSVDRKAPSSYHLKVSKTKVSIALSNDIQARR